MKPPYKPSSLDGPVCCRELKPGVARENHTLLDHVDYNEKELEEELPE